MIYISLTVILWFLCGAISVYFAGVLDKLHNKAIDISFNKVLFFLGTIGFVMVILIISIEFLDDMISYIPYSPLSWIYKKGRGE